MKYVNHMTIAHDDSKIQALRDKHGLAGYGAYWIIVEKIAAQVRPESPEPELSLSLKKWALHLDIRPVFAAKLIRTQSELGLIRMRSDGEVWTLSIPNILKYADEYSKKVGIKSRLSPDRCPDSVGNPGLTSLTGKEKDLKTGPVDNPAASPEGGADGGGGSLGAPPPPAPAALKADPDVKRLGDLIAERRRELGIPEPGAKQSQDNGGKPPVADHTPIKGEEGEHDGHVLHERTRG